MRAGLVFSVVFFQSQLKFLLLLRHQHSDRPHPWFQGAPLFLCCLAICVCTAKEHVFDYLHALHYCLRLTGICKAGFDRCHRRISFWPHTGRSNQASSKANSRKPFHKSSRERGTGTSLMPSWRSGKKRWSEVRSTHHIIKQTADQVEGGTVYEGKRDVDKGCREPTEGGKKEDETRHK